MGNETLCSPKCIVDDYQQSLCIINGTPKLIHAALLSMAKINIGTSACKHQQMHPWLENPATTLSTKHSLHDTIVSCLLKIVPRIVNIYCLQR